MRASQNPSAPPIPKVSSIQPAARYSVKVRDPRLILEAATLARACAAGSGLGNEPGDTLRHPCGDAVLFAYRLRCGGVDVRDVSPSGGGAA